MRCHDVLSIKENATQTEINAAFDKKLNRLATTEQELDDASYSLKKKELFAAKEECLAWIDKRPGDRQIARLSTTSGSPVTLYSTCCGPFSGILNVFCILGCGFGEECTPCCIIADLGVYAYGIVTFMKWKNRRDDEKSRENARIYSNAKKRENIQLESRLADLKQKYQVLESQYKREAIKRETIVAFADFFSSAGAEDTQVLIQLQKKVADAKYAEMHENLQLQNKLELEIENNKLFVIF